MSNHEQLHQTLRAAAQFLDSAASQIRELPLDPPKENLLLLAGALANVFQVLHTVELAAPALSRPLEEPSSETREANRRLGEALLRSEELAEGGNLENAQQLLEQFASVESSGHHRDIAVIEATRYKLRRASS